MGGRGKMGAKLCWALHSKRMRGKLLQISEGKLEQDRKKNVFFPLRVLNTQKGVPIPGDTQASQKMVLGLLWS